MNVALFDCATVIFPKYFKFFLASAQRMEATKKIETLTKIRKNHFPWQTFTFTKFDQIVQKPQIRPQLFLTNFLVFQEARLSKCCFQRTHQQKNLALNSPPNGPSCFKFPMANCGRAYFIKAALLAGILLVLLNLYNYRLESNNTPTSMSLGHAGYARFVY